LGIACKRWIQRVLAEPLAGGPSATSAPEVAFAGETPARSPGATSETFRRDGFRSEEELSHPLSAERADAALMSESSSHAGLLMVVPVLRRLGLPRWLAGRPEFVEAGFPARLVGRIGRRAGMADTDPLARVLAILAGDTAEGDVPEWVYTAWWAAVRRWFRRERLGWREGFERAGRLQFDRPHLDITFIRQQVNLPWRRLALDVDPDWVPWLGCVVKFNYVSDHG
jgi:hypothetical protein